MSAKRKAEVLLQLDETARAPLYQQIYEQIRDAVMSGRLVQGDRLVSIRKLSSDLGVSHTTVEQAYLQLTTEGLVANVPRSGYVVEHVDSDYFKLERASGEEEVRKLAETRDREAFFAENRSGGEMRYDFSYANLQPDSFPVRTWRQLLDEVLYAKTAPEFARYAYTDEVGSLQAELARLLRRTRGVDCSAEQVVVQAGTGEALTMIMQLFNRATDVIGMEDPGYATVREVARRQDFSLVPLPSDQGVEAFLAAVERHCPTVVFCTPSHQFPTGLLLPLDARTRLLKWAEEHDAYIIEDDSCNEFRYATRPVPSLQSLDAYGRVIYLCNVSKVLSPSLRIAYAVLPPRLLERYWDLFNYAHPSVSWLSQETLARFIAQGHWDAHVRKTAKGNRRRHDELLRCLRAEMGGVLDISGTDTGMHLYVTVRNGMSEQQLIDAALAQGVKVYGTARMRFPSTAPTSSVMIGFSAIAFEDIEPGVRALRRAWLGD
ncbi:PLP-dependent aminotransferase family protein [Adlercreutzia sp. ZJ242]|uniref:MocR-like pyridoxine biosynthesis transcription factor PdxR n=1 Tax=Adlercreutzia sp. ZJ242 TaxID=2709409 RepID=UPI0013E9D1EA|nr:PLP-dependent aminotransferase family protein [Adlercreutzia sp. ZJ242]